MKIEDMQKYLTQISNNMPETKVLNAILTCFVELKKLEERIGLIEDRLSPTVNKAAEALNPEMPEDNN